MDSISKNVFNNSVNENVLKDVSLDRMYDIAKQLAQYEYELKNNRKSIDISLMESNGCQSIKYCEVVSVPTSTHVAQIVGKKGSKIKLLRMKSSTCIQTPNSGEEPIFTITGIKENVLKVKAEILSASEHFSLINEKRIKKLNKNTAFDGSMTLNLIIPSFLIGLIVGKNGVTIRNIQKMTNTWIETPKIESNNAFKINGSEPNVESAKNLIIYHMKSKTKQNFSANRLANGDIEINLEINHNQNERNFN